MVKGIETTDNRAKRPANHRTAARGRLAGLEDQSPGLRAPQPRARADQHANAAENFYHRLGRRRHGNATFTQGAATGGDTVRQSMTYGDRTRGHHLGRAALRPQRNIYKFDANANFSRSWDRGGRHQTTASSHIGNFQLGSLIVRADGLDGVYSRRAPRLTVTTRTGAPVRSVRRCAAHAAYTRTSPAQTRLSPT